MYIMYILICFKLSLLFAFLVEIIKMHRWWVYILFKPSYWNFCYFYFSFDNVIIQNDWPHHLLAWSPSINLHNKLQVSELHTYLLIHFNVHFFPLYKKYIFSTCSTLSTVEHQGPSQRRAPAAKQPTFRRNLGCFEFMPTDPFLWPLLLYRFWVASYITFIVICLNCVHIASLCPLYFFYLPS